MEFKPFGKYMLAEREEIKESEGGIELPTAQKTKIANIISIGSEVENTSLNKAKVLFSHFSPITLNNKEYILLTEKDILGVFSPTAP
jgi:co-chaperonin GroES (HSP10)